MNFSRTNFAVCCAFSLLTVSSSLALDLTPHSGVIQLSEGPPFPVTEFNDGKYKVKWASPRGWLLNGGPNSVSLSAPDGTGAWMKLVIVKKDAPPDGAAPAPTPTPSADASTPQNDLQTKAMQFIPAGAKDVVFVKTVPSPFVLGRLMSTEFIFAFSRYGSKDSISVSFVEYSDTERLVVLISAGEKDFDKVRAAAISSLFSWQAVK